MKGKFLPAMKLFYEERFKVRRNDKGISFGYQMASHCPNTEFAGKYKSGGFMDADLLIKVSLQYESASWVAAAGACEFGTDYRPVTGGIIMNMYHMASQLTNDYQQALFTMLHETMHVLGFTDSMVKNFVDSNGIKLKTNNYITKIGTKLFLSSPKVLAVAKAYFGCETITGIPMEDNGGQGSVNSHFEAT